MINPIYSSQINYSKSVKRANSPSFTAHPDYELLSKHFNIKASGYFRRGTKFGRPVDEYKDVVEVLQNVFKNNPKEKKNMLIIGIGSSQEPFSDLAVIKDFQKDRDLYECLDLNIVDLQSKPSVKKLYKDSFLDYPDPPKYGESSFIYDPINSGTFVDSHYRVNDAIFNFLNNTYNAPAKSKWETRIQDVAKDYPSEKFDVIAANNVLPYIGDNAIIANTINELKRSLKPGGYFITDPKKFSYMRIPGVLDNMNEVKEGIYQKIK